MIDLHSYGCDNHGVNLLPIPEPTWALINPPRYLHYDDYGDDENDASVWIMMMRTTSCKSSLSTFFSLSLSSFSSF